MQLRSESESESQQSYCHKSTTKHRMKADEGVIARDKIPPYTYTNIYTYIYIYIGGESLHMDMAIQGFMLHGCNNRQATCNWTCNHIGKI